MESSDRFEWASPRNETCHPWEAPLLAILMAILASFLFAQFGLIAAIYAHNFDTLSMYSNFLLLPLIYLGDELLEML